MYGCQCSLGTRPMTSWKVVRPRLNQLDWRRHLWFRHNSAQHSMHGEEYYSLSCNSWKLETLQCVIALTSSPYTSFSDWFVPKNTHTILLHFNNLWYKMIYLREHDSKCEHGTCMNTEHVCLIRSSWAASGAYDHTRAPWHVLVTITNIPTVQLRSAGFGLHPFSVHTALIPITGTRRGSQL